MLMIMMIWITVNFMFGYVEGWIDWSDEWRLGMKGNTEHAWKIKFMGKIHLDQSTGPKGAVDWFPF